MSWNSSIRGLLRELRFTLIRFEEDGEAGELEEAAALLAAIMDEVGVPDTSEEPEPPKSN